MFRGFREKEHRNAPQFETESCHVLIQSQIRGYVMLLYTTPVPCLHLMHYSCGRLVVTLHQVRKTME